jgi:hypothetical protein
MQMMTGVRKAGASSVIGSPSSPHKRPRTEEGGSISQTNKESASIPRAQHSLTASSPTSSSPRVSKPNSGIFVAKRRVATVNASQR